MRTYLSHAYLTANHQELPCYCAPDASSDDRIYVVTQDDTPIALVQLDVGTHTDEIATYIGMLLSLGTAPAHVDLNSVRADLDRVRTNYAMEVVDPDWDHYFAHAIFSYQEATELGVILCTDDERVEEEDAYWASTPEALGWYPH